VSAGVASGEIELDPEHVVSLVDGEGGAQVVDVREPHEREAGHIADSRHVPLAQLPAESQTFARERPIVFYCRVGSRSLMAAQAFRGGGFEAYSMSGGLVRWVAEGRPLSPAGGYVAGD
jgi:rhodanese-related sulfurtransferase